MIETWEALGWWWPTLVLLALLVGAVFTAALMD